LYSIPILKFTIIQFNNIYNIAPAYKETQIRTLDAFNRFVWYYV